MSAALPVYRNLLRATRLVFQGDATLLNAARADIRQGFLKNATLEPTSPEFLAAINHGQEVAKVLRENVVQGKREGDTYKLRIHEETERGDNDTIKVAGKNLSAGGGKCCSS
ncbi:hypothetical protein O1611_g8773 [Lasiodiplodia mahajangana]|uniref:Uncharacterized protein n=1 Tax=Lasiodiplodia mahajangana TaxID=1108764 RepID=A0ACC2JBK5_9PEZI|nr:hypothetical protein O1611_g8773 [Lasiodiplodia mahajangana]